MHKRFDRANLVWLWLLILLLVACSDAPVVTAPPPTAAVAVDSFWTTGGIFKTTDGGKTWASTYPDDKEGFHIISCPVVTICYVVGDSLTVTNDGGLSWQRVGPNSDYFGLACPEREVCYTWYSDLKAMGYISVTEDGGKNWEKRFADSSERRLDQFSCFSPNACVMLNQDFTIEVTSDKARTWTKFPKSANFPTKLRCLDAVTCVGISYDTKIAYAAFVTTRNAGQSWEAVPMPYLRTVSDIVCLNVSTCIFAAETLAATNDGGKTWKETKEPNALINCPAATACYKVVYGNSLSFSSDAGQTWQERGKIANESIKGISCPAVQICYAAADTFRHSNSPPYPTPIP